MEFSYCHGRFSYTYNFGICRSHDDNATIGEGQSFPYNFNVVIILIAQWINWSKPYWPADRSVHQPMVINMNVKISVDCISLWLFYFRASVMDTMWLYTTSFLVLLFLLEWELDIIKLKPNRSLRNAYRKWEHVLNFGMILFWSSRKFVYLINNWNWYAWRILRSRRNFWLVFVCVVCIITWATMQMTRYTHAWVLVEKVCFLKRNSVEMCEPDAIGTRCA